MNARIHLVEHNQSSDFPGGRELRPAEIARPVREQKVKQSCYGCSPLLCLFSAGCSSSDHNFEQLPCLIGEALADDCPTLRTKDDEAPILLRACKLLKVMMSMSTTGLDSVLESQPASGFARVKTILLEPLLIAAVAAFWMVALPFVAMSLVCMKVGDALTAMEAGSPARSNPLFLRGSRAPEGTLIVSSRSPARTGHV